MQRAEAGQHVPAQGLLEGGQVQLAEHRQGVLAPLLGEQDLEAGRIDAGRIEAPGLQCGHDAVDDQGRRRGEQQDVVPGAQGFDFTGARWNGFRHTGHGQGVGEDEPLEAEGVDEQIADDGLRQGGGQATHAVQRGHL